MSYQIFDDFHDPSANTFDTLLGSLQYDEVRGGTGTWEADYDSTVLCSNVVNQLREEGGGGKERGRGGGGGRRGKKREGEGERSVCVKGGIGTKGSAHV